VNNHTGKTHGASTVQAPVGVRVGEIADLLL
jgi:hypothetical protein